MTESRKLKPASTQIRPPNRSISCNRVITRLLRIQTGQTRELPTILRRTIHGLRNLCHCVQRTRAETPWIWERLTSLPILTMALPAEDHTNPPRLKTHQLKKLLDLCNFKELHGLALTSQAVATLKLGTLAPSSTAQTSTRE